MTNADFIVDLLRGSQIVSTHVHTSDFSRPWMREIESTPVDGANGEKRGKGILNCYACDLVLRNSSGETTMVRIDQFLGETRIRVLNPVEEQQECTETGEERLVLQKDASNCAPMVVGVNDDNNNNTEKNVTGKPMTGCANSSVQRCTKRKRLQQETSIAEIATDLCRTNDKVSVNNSTATEKKTTELKSVAPPPKVQKTAENSRFCRVTRCTRDETKKPSSRKKRTMDDAFSLNHRTRVETGVSLIYKRPRCVEKNKR